MKHASFIFSLIFFLSNISLAQDAIYKVEFISNWSSATHPIDYPSSSAHWSPLIGTTHKDAALLLQTGVIASDGVEQVAETGGTSVITQEINSLINAGLAHQVINGSGLGSGPGTITVNNVNVDADFPYISLITMIAPSPDWVAMIGNQKLTNNANNWENTISVDVYPVDAGTDSGITYNSGNADITPHIEMSSLQGVAPFSNEIIGTFVFTLEQVLSTPEEELANTILVYPNPIKEDVIIKNVGNYSLEKVELYSVSGKKIRELNNFSDPKNITLNTSLSSGVYFLKLHTNDGVLNRKLIKE